MKRHSDLRHVIALSIVCFSVWQAGGAATIKKQPALRGKPAFTVSLDISPSSMTEGDSISFLLLLRAESHESWFVHVPIEEGLAGDFLLSIREHGSVKEIEPLVWHHAQQSSTAPVLALSPPGTILGGESEDTAKNYGMRTGHTYDVTAIYRSQILAKSWHRVPVLSSFDGELRSNTVQVKVEP